MRGCVTAVFAWFRIYQTSENVGGCPPFGLRKLVPQQARYTNLNKVAGKMLHAMGIFSSLHGKVPTHV